MARIYVQVEGLDEVVKALKDMPEHGKAVMAGSVNKGTGFLAPKIRQAVPFDPDDDTHLKDNVRSYKAKGKKVMQTGTIYVGSKAADYGFHVETGHRTHKGRKIPAKPFMRQTTSKYEEEIATIVVNDILDGIGV